MCFDVYLEIPPCICFSYIWILLLTTTRAYVINPSFWTTYNLAESLYGQCWFFYFTGPKLCKSLRIHPVVSFILPDKPIQLQPFVFFDPTYDARLKVTWFLCSCKQAFVPNEVVIPLHRSHGPALPLDLPVCWDITQSRSGLNLTDFLLDGLVVTQARLPCSHRNAFTGTKKDKAQVWKWAAYGRSRTVFLSPSTVFSWSNHETMTLLYLKFRF